MLDGKCAVLGITGGIAAYKACDIARGLIKRGCRVRAVMTEHAKQFITPLTLETLTGSQVYSDNFERAWEIGHISLAKSADILIIAPATANVIGKIACGIADDLLSTTVMACTCPVLIAPAMNSAMWRSSAVAANMKTLAERGFLFVGPDSGLLACGDSDVGRMSDPSEIVERASGILIGKRDLEGVNVLVTAGPTREMLDPVRFLSNRSTGKMGYAICERAIARGANVELVTGPVDLAPPVGANVTRVISACDMFEAVTRIAERCDVVIQAAAPADYSPESVSEQKIKKTGSGMTLKLVNTRDIAQALGERKRSGQVLVAFAAETNDAKENAAKKRERKNADFIVLNDVTKQGAGFATDTNIISVISESEAVEYPIMSKLDAADIILDHVARARECAMRK